MIRKSFLFVAIFIVLFGALSARSQNVFNGTVVDVKDGKTIVLEIPNGPMKVVLQYIEVPEPEKEPAPTNDLLDALKQSLENLQKA